MEKIKKAFMSLGTLVSIAAPVAAVVSCGAEKDVELIKYVKYTGDDVVGATTHFITDGGAIDDKSFNQSGFEGFQAGTGQSDDSKTEKPKTASEILGSYETAVTKGAKTIVAMGYNHLTALNAFTEQHPELGFIFIDNDLPSSDGKKTLQQGNVVSVKFYTGQAAFLMGIVAAHEANNIDDTKPQIGYWRGMDIPSVNAFSNGLKAGVEFYNANLPSGKVKVELIDGGVAGNFDQGKGKTIAEKLLADGADLLMAVAGPQTFDAIAAIKAKSGSKAKVIGVDTDIHEQLTKADDKAIMFGSIMKNLKGETEKAIKALIADKDDATYGFGKVHWAGLAGGGVEIKNAGVPLKLPDGTLGNSKTWQDVIDEAKKLKY